MTDDVGIGLDILRRYDDSVHPADTATGRFRKDVSPEEAASRPDINLSEHDVRVRIAGSSGSYEEYVATCVVSGVEPKSKSGYRIDRLVSETYGIGHGR